MKNSPNNMNAMVFSGLEVLVNDQGMFMTLTLLYVGVKRSSIFLGFLNPRLGHQCWDVTSFFMQ